jgi:hypothetical protein
MHGRGKRHAWYKQITMKSGNTSSQPNHNTRTQEKAAQQEQDICSGMNTFLEKFARGQDQDHTRYTEPSHGSHNGSQYIEKESNLTFTRLCQIQQGPMSYLHPWLLENKLKKERNQDHPHQ